MIHRCSKPTEQEKRAAMEFNRSLAMAGLDPLSPEVAHMAACEMLCACPELPVDGPMAVQAVEAIFVLARRKVRIPAVHDLAAAWEELKGDRMSRIRAENAPFVARWVASKIWFHSVALFEDGVMGALCRSLGMSNQLAFPSQYDLSKDRELREAYHRIAESAERVNRIGGHGNSRLAVLKVPSGEKYRRRNAIAGMPEQLRIAI